MGVYIGPLEHYLGFGQDDVYEKWEGEWDCVFYELKKFIGQCGQPPKGDAQRGH